MGEGEKLVNFPSIAQTSPTDTGLSPGFSTSDEVPWKVPGKTVKDVKALGLLHSCGKPGEVLGFKLQFCPLWSFGE